VRLLHLFSPVSMPNHAIANRFSKRALLGIGIIALTAALAYRPAMHGGFLLDDDLLLTENPLVKVPNGLAHIWFTTDAVDYWPVANTSFWIGWRLWGLNPTGYHVVNLLLHIANALLVWLVLRQLAIPWAFLAALLFALHPVNVESVAWISQRKGLLATLFVLFSVVFYLWAEQRRRPIEGMPIKSEAKPSAAAYYWLSVVAFLLAMLSKGSVAILPLVLLAIVWWQKRRIQLRDFVRTIPYWLIAFIFTGVNVWFQSRLSSEPFRHASLADRVVEAPAMVWFYLSKAILPIHLQFIYPQWQIDAGRWVWWLPAIAAILLTGILLWQRNSWWDRPLLFAWIIYCVALVPVMGFTDISYMKYSLVADHYQYLAIIAFVALVAAVCHFIYSHLPRNRQRPIEIVSAVLVAVLFFMTWQQSGLYVNGTTLYAASLKENPTSWLLQFNLANALDDEHRPDEAIQHYRQAIRWKPEFVEAHYNLGNVLSHTGQTQAAIDEYQQVLQLNPAWAAQVHCALGVLANKNGEHEKAIEEYQQAVNLKPDSAEYHYNLGNALLAVGRVHQAQEQYQRALDLKPDFADARDKLINLTPATGNLAAAIERDQQILKQNPNFAEVHYNLANALLKVGRVQEAMDHYRQALQIKPELVEAANGLGAALLSSGQPQQSLEYFDRAVRAKPDYVQAYANLALADAQLNRSNDAVSAGQKALALARSQGNNALVTQIGQWLANYRSSLAQPSNSDVKSPQTSSNLAPSR
jgi:protein O-mannosyl-transferase